MDKINILVTGTGGGSVGEQVLKALKLSSLPMHLYGCDTTRISKGFNEVDEAFVLPHANDTSYIKELISICINKAIRVLIPGSEPELKAISANRTIFKSKNILLLINPSNVIETCLDKNKTASFLENNGFFSPKSILIQNHLDLDKVNFFPAILKPSVGAGGSANVMVAQNKNELKTFGQYLLTIYNEFVIQEYVGNAENEYTVGVLCSMKGKIINSIAIKRNIRSGLGHKTKVPNNTGKKEFGDYLFVSSGISQGEVIDRSFINEICESIAIKLGCTSAVNIQCRVVNQKVYVFEINPRFSGTTSLRALVGFNEPDVLIRNEILKEEIQNRFPYKLGYVLRGLSEIYIPQ